MVVTGPLRGLTDVVDLRVNGKSATKVKYGKTATVTGTLVRRSGAVAVAKVEVVETYGEGSKPSTQTTVVATDGDGGFSLDLPKGPSRKIAARYNGDRRYLGTSSAPAKLAVKGKVALKAPRNVSSKEGIVFRGKVGTGLRSRPRQARKAARGPGPDRPPVEGGREVDPLEQQWQVPARLQVHGGLPSRGDLPVPCGGPAGTGLSLPAVEVEGEERDGHPLTDELAAPGLQPLPVSPDSGLPDALASKPR